MLSCFHALHHEVYACALCILVLNMACCASCQLPPGLFAVLPTDAPWLSILPDPPVCLHNWMSGVMLFCTTIASLFGVVTSRLFWCSTGAC